LIYPEKSSLSEVYFYPLAEYTGYFFKRIINGMKKNDGRNARQVRGQKGETKKHQAGEKGHKMDKTEKMEKMDRRGKNADSGRGMH